MINLDLDYIENVLIKMDKLLFKIKEKESELDNLREEYSKIVKLKYEHIIGKFFSLSATEMIKITDISDTDNNSICVECLTICGGKYERGRIEFRIYDNRWIKFSDIDDGLISQVSRDEFINFLYKSFEYTKENVDNII